MARAPLEVAGAGADQGLTLTDDALAAPPAYAAVGVHDDGARLHEGVQDAFLQGGQVDLAAGGDNEETDGRSDLAALDDGCAQAQVLQAAVVAGAEEGLVDLNAGAVGDRCDVVDKVGLRDDGYDGREVDVIDLLELCVGVTAEAGRGLPAAVCREVVQSDLVDLHQGGLGARLDAEVADGDAVAHGERGHAGAGEFHGVVVGAVGPDLSDDGQDQVAGGRPVPQLPAEVEAEGLRDQDPGLAGHHAVEIIRTSDAGAEGPEGTVGTGVAVRAEDQLAGNHVVLDHDLVTYAGALIEGDAVLLGEIAHFFLRGSGLGAVAGDVVVYDPDELGDVGDARVLEVVVHIDGQMRGAVVAHEVVELDGVDIIRVRLRDARGPRHDLFRNGHSHSFSPVKISVPDPV